MILLNVFLVFSGGLKPMDVIFHKDYGNLSVANGVVMLISMMVL